MSEVNRPWENDPDAGSFGAWLRRQREVREITLREIAEESKISIRYLEALEEDHFDILPAPVFAKGFLREYARFVGLDPDDVVNSYLSAVPSEEEEEVEPAPAVSSERQISLLPLLGVLAVLIVALGGLYWFSQRSSGEAEIPEMVPPPVEPTAGVVEVVEPDPAEPIRLTLDFSQTSWVEVVVDGEREVSELRVQGESLRRSANEEIRLTLSNVGGVRLEINGQPFPLEIDDDEELVIDLEALRQRDLLPETEPPSESPTGPAAAA